MLTPTATPSTSRGLIRILGVGFGLAVIVGSTLGIGVLRTPGLVAGQLPSSTAILTVWIVGGLYTLVGAICFLIGALLLLPERTEEIDPDAAPGGERPALPRRRCR